MWGVESEISAIKPRKPRFEWSRSDVCHWVPGNPDAAHTLNVMHVIFPQAERAFCRVLSSALKHTQDPRLVADIKGFIAQEGAHAHAHAAVFELLLGSSPYVGRAHGQTKKFLRFMLGESHTKNPLLLKWRLASVAATEHLTTAIGVWTLSKERLEEHGCDPQMTALVKWHGAEEVEHRSVAFDTHAAVQRKFAYLTRVVAMAVWFPLLTALWFKTAHSLLKADTSLPHRRALSLRAVRRAVKQGIVPGVWATAVGALAFCKPGYHPSSHVSPDVAKLAEDWLSGPASPLYSPAT